MVPQPGRQSRLTAGLGNHLLRLMHFNSLSCCRNARDGNGGGTPGVVRSRKQPSILKLTALESALSSTCLSTASTGKSGNGTGYFNASMPEVKLEYPASLLDLLPLNLKFRRAHATRRGNLGSAFSGTAEEENEKRGGKREMVVRESESLRRCAPPLP